MTIDKEVTIYTAPGCPWCRRTKDYLAQKGFSYLEHNVARDRAKADEIIEKSGQTGVPVIIIGGQIVIGFNQDRLDSLLSREDRV